MCATTGELFPLLQHLWRNPSALCEVTFTDAGRSLEIRPEKEPQRALVRIDPLSIKDLVRKGTFVNSVFLGVGEDLSERFKGTVSYTMNGEHWIHRKFKAAEDATVRWIPQVPLTATLRIWTIPNDVVVKIFEYAASNMEELVFDAGMSYIWLNVVIAGKSTLAESRIKLDGLMGMICHSKGPQLSDTTKIHIALASTPGGRTSDMVSMLTMGDLRKQLILYFTDLLYQMDKYQWPWQPELWIDRTGVIVDKCITPDGFPCADADSWDCSVSGESFMSIALLVEDRYSAVPSDMRVTLIPAKDACIAHGKC
ncbi:hypothetical protein EK21DRAFT_88878 [Setomelanomma holmii]|uniref:Uncharacterized protein n=1 Tax=Setomelanomma holmii TaxID=210430 RepID=A0A9P4HBI2_9PLEO|nr:hypothetical protein EK21DRAFT_88878 [Setomelanomma holmii]